MRLLTISLLLLSTYALGQEPEQKDPVTQKMLLDAATQGFKLNADLTVFGNVSIEAVLLPARVAQPIFGKVISDNYMVIELIISNRSRDASLIVHSIFIDYSRWILSGKAIADYSRPRHRLGNQSGNPIEAWQAESLPDQVAAVEYRLARGHLLQRQPWSARNIAIRGLEAAGSIASGYLFAFKEVGIGKGVNAFNGNFVPAMKVLFPDGAQDQANRISDLVFRVNKVVPKDSSEVLVGLFPISRFLPPTMAKIFKRSPALFFSPLAGAVDPKGFKALYPVISRFFPRDYDIGADLQQAITDPYGPNRTLEVFNGISLNRVRILVGGIMSVDVDTIPATIESLDCDETDLAMLWAETGLKTCTIHGRYLSGGTVAIAEASKLNITDLAVIQEGSSDSVLRFQMKLNKALPSGAKLTFQVNKKDKNQKVVEGVKFDLVVPDFTLTSPVIEKVDRSGDTLTITGQRFFTTDANPLVVKLEPSAAAGVDEVAVKKFDRTPKEIKIDLAGLSLKPACWTPSVTVGTMAASGASAFAQPPTPKIASAKKNGTRVVLSGDQFLDLKSCKKALTFEIAEQAAGSAFKVVENLTIVSGKEVSFDYPKTPADGKFKVRVLVAGVESDTRNIE